MTITLEGDDGAVVGLLAGHVLAFYSTELAALPGVPLHTHDVEYVRLVVNGQTGALDMDACKVVPLLYNVASTLYNTDLYIPDETPYEALWRTLKDVLSARLFEVLRRDYNLKNTAYSTRARNRKKGRSEGEKVKQRSLF